MKNADNQNALGDQSHQLTQFGIWKQQNEISRLFYGIFIGPAAFFAFMNKKSQQKRHHMIRRCFYEIPKQTRIFQNFRQIPSNFFNENMKTAPGKSLFCSNLCPLIFIGHIIKETTISTLISQLDAIF